MKINILAFLFFLSYNFFFAQNTTIPDCKWGIGLQVNTVEQTQRFTNQTVTSYWRDDDDLYISGTSAKTNDYSFSLSIVCDRWIATNKFIHSTIGINRVDVRSNAEEMDSSGNTYSYSNSKQQNNLEISSGIGWSADWKGIKVYGGIVSTISAFGKSDVHKFYQWNDPNGQFVFSNEIEGKISNGYSIGIGNFGGIRKEFKKFSLISGISFLYAFNHLGGSESFTAISKNFSGVFNQGTINIHPVVNEFGVSKMRISLGIIYNF